MCLGQSSHFLSCHISSTKPGRNSYFCIALIPWSPSCALYSKLAPLSPSPKAGELSEVTFSCRLWWELWWNPSLCFWLVPWMALSGVQAGLELPWVWLSGLSSSQGIAGLCSASAAPTAPALHYWQRGTHIRDCICTQQSFLCAGQRCKFYYAS